MKWHEDEAHNMLHDPAENYPRQKMTIEEYLELDRSSPEKHEYFEGGVFKMEGANFTHGQIIDNTNVQLRQKLKGSICQSYTSNMRTHIRENSLFTYPDLYVICGKPFFLNNDECNLLNPTVIIEVLSPSTRNYDRGAKFKLYRDIQTLKSYILIDSTAIHVACYHKDPMTGWGDSKNYTALHEAALFEHLNVKVPLKKIYEDTRLAAE
ncbi:Uma2 family endonuclease [Hufsiella ginkgonis]|uniref:Uma2 family endonuclease n=1 Tax=Hufsiella ginkgonis TaxID=2695274 RepID=A0A7K1XYH2_9SPHI|nr:Uma2 family endonuclease [Hufsiella ginkgonis]MXV16054.1 Uma2 family endonuclease [Hufsiella ginkgonis]